MKVLIKNLAIFFLFPSKEFLTISLKIQLLKLLPKNKEQRKKQLGVDKLVTTSVVDRNYFLRFRLLLLKSYGSGSDF